jgi:uncharacterized protein (UPF0335 family)
MSDVHSNVPVPRARWQASLREQNDAAARQIKAACAQLDAKPSRSRVKGTQPSGMIVDEAQGATHRFAKEQLKSFIERVQRLQEEKKAISDDIADVYAEAKGNGFDKAALRTVIRILGQDANERKEQDAIVETYLRALGAL